MRTRRGFVIAAALLALAFARAAPALAQDTIDKYVGMTVTAVRFEIDDRPDLTGALLGLVDVKVGEPLRIIALRSSVNRLASVGTFDDVSPVAIDAAGGVDILFKLSARHPVDRMVFTGDTGLPANDLQKRVKDQYGGMPTNVPPGKVTQAIRDILNDEGYLTADLTVSVEKRSNPDRATLQFNVTAGERATITEAVVNNGAQSVFSNEQLEARTGVGVRQPYRIAQINTALAALRDDLQSRGYFAAVASIEPVVSADRRSVKVTLTVDAGPKVEIRWSPADQPPPGRVEDLVPIARERAVDDDLLEDSRLRIEDALRADGYANAGVKMSKDTSTPGVLIVTFDMNRGSRFRVDHVEIPAHPQVTEPTFEALFGIKPGDVLSQARVSAGLVRLRAKYLSLGFYQVKTGIEQEQIARPTSGGEVWVVLRPQIVDGPQGHIAAIEVRRDTSHIPEADLLDHMRSKKLEPYVAAYVPGDLDALSSLYLDRGFRTATVSMRPDFSPDGQAVTLIVEISEGPQIIVADIQVIGNQSVSDEAVIAEMTLKPGDPFSETERFESQRRISDMGLFRRVSVDEAPRLPGETRAHVIVAVDEAPATTVSYGGGVDAGRLTRTASDGVGQEDYIAVSPRGFFAIQRRNLFGGNRSIDFFTRISAKPTSAPGDPTRDGRGFGFLEGRILGTYRERHAFGTDADLLLGGTLEQSQRPTFNLQHKAVSAEALKKLAPRLSFSMRYALDFSKVFDSRIEPQDQLTIDRLFPQVRLSIVSASLLSDRRNDGVSPSRGTLSSVDAELAARALGSEVGYFKTFMQGSYFHALTDNRRFVFAGRAQLGLAWGFETTVNVQDAQGNPVLDANGQPVTTQTEGNLPASARFFAGGSTTVRGFQQDRLGVPEILDGNGLSNGGNGLVVLNAELRTALFKLFGYNLGAAVFTDSGNVFAKARDVDLSRLRGSAGFGLRYDSPLGPVRVDVGYKFTRITYSGGARERGWEFHFNIGEAF